MEVVYILKSSEHKAGSKAIKNKMNLWAYKKIEKAQARLEFLIEQYKEDWLYTHWAFVKNEKTWEVIEFSIEKIVVL